VMVQQTMQMGQARDIFQHKNIPVIPDVFVHIKHPFPKFLSDVQNIFAFFVCFHQSFTEKSCSHLVCNAAGFTIFTLVLTRTIQCVTVFCYELLCNITHYLYQKK